jgi:hypothetical protein
VRAVCCDAGEVALLGINVLYGLLDVIHGNDGKNGTEDLADYDAQVSERIQRNPKSCMDIPLEE